MLRISKAISIEGQVVLCIGAAEPLHDAFSQGLRDGRSYRARRHAGTFSLSPDNLVGMRLKVLQREKFPNEVVTIPPPSGRWTKEKISH